MVAFGLGDLVVCYLLLLLGFELFVVYGGLLLCLLFCRLTVCMRCLLVGLLCCCFVSFAGVCAGLMRIVLEYVFLCCVTAAACCVGRGYDAV